MPTSHGEYWSLGEKVGSYGFTLKESAGRGQGLSRYSITTPIYYVNAEPHLGHAYTTIAADILARHHRRLGDDVFFLTGTDEHGNKVAQAAEERGLTPREHVDGLAPKFREMAARVERQQRLLHPHDRSEHEAYVQRFVERLRAAGDIEKRTYGGLYCTACEGFYYERDLVDGKCPVHRTEPVWLEEENYYFLLSRYQERLRQYYLEHPDWVRPRRATTRPCRSSRAASTTSRSAASRSHGASRYPGIRSR